MDTLLLSDNHNDIFTIAKEFRSQYIYETRWSKLFVQI